jgi:hypothetical protein
VPENRLKKKEKFMNKISLKETKNLKDLTDWEKISNMSETEIEKNALSDLDNQPLSLDLKGLKLIKKIAYESK